MSDPTTQTARGGAKASRLLADHVDGYAIIRLPLRGFETLSIEDKILAWHLCQASLAGRDITYDQDHRLALRIRHELEAVLTHAGSIPRDLLAKIRAYTVVFWIANGPYHERTKQKIQPRFSVAEWHAALASANAHGAAIDDTDRAAVDRVMFDPSVDPTLTAKSPPPGMDILTASANNYYDGVTLADLKGFEEQYPLNSRLVKREGALFEEVYRAGRAAAPGQRPAPPGRYHKELAAVVTHLREALPYTGTAQAATLRHLIDYFETGSPDDFDKANVAWLKDNPKVDLILGFIESYKDARGVKGEWEGIVSMIDAESTRVMKGVADNAQYFEDRMPWDDAYKKKGVNVPVAKAIQVICGHGGSGPSLPAGVNLPNSNAIRERHGSKSFLLTNVIRAIDGAVSELAAAEFAPADEREAARKYGGMIADVEVALHEIVGHGSGRMSEALLGKDPAVYLREYANALEEARAELVALHHIWDPKMRALMPGCDDGCAEAAYRAYARQDLTNLRRVSGPRIEDDHMRATHLIVQYAKAKGAVVLEERDGQHFQRVASVEGMRAAVAALLAKVMRIKAEGLYDEARALFETYGVSFEPSLRDEVTRRAAAAGLPQFYAFIMPTLEPVRDASGAIVDVRVGQAASFEAQMLLWDHARQ